MTTSASLDVQIVNCTTACTYIQNLVDSGWCLNYEGKAFYLPLGDNDFDWASGELTKNELFEIFSNKEKNNEIIGICMTWGSTEIGGDFLFRLDGTISVNLNVNRKLTSSNYTDINWYVEKIIVGLQVGDVLVESFYFTESM